LSSGLISVASFVHEEKQAHAAQDVIDLDEDSDEKVDKKSAPAAAVDAGPMSPEMTEAKKLFDAQKWDQAAPALFRVAAGESKDDAANQQLAQYYLAIALYRLKLYQSSYALFSLVAATPEHAKFNETLLWLAKLATQLPEPADIIEQVGRYSDKEIATFDNEQQRELFYQLNYLLGRYKYRNRQFEDAIRLFNKVQDTSEYYVHAQFFAGTSYVQLRKSVPAVKAFQRAAAAVEAGTQGIEDEARVRDLAYLSMARTYYSASIKLDPETNAPSVDSQKLSAAVKYWNQIDTSSEYWLDALFEESWAYFMAGQYPKALGNIHTLQSPYFPGAFYPESEILKAVIYFSNCNYEAATTVVARFNKRYVPIQDELKKVLARFKGEQQAEPFFKFLISVRKGTADLAPSIKGIVEGSLSDRQLLRNIEYVRVLDEEQARFQQGSASFKSSSLGSQVQEALKIARDLAVQNAGDLARARYERNLEELDEHLRNGEKILIDITSAQRNELDTAIAANQVSKAESKIFGIVKPDEEHMLWPFDGEYWRDELGFYRQVVESACGR
jgi:hypothetical protein